MHPNAYIVPMPWDIDLTEVAPWLETLNEKDYENVMAAIYALEVDGPALGRPFVDQIKSSRHKNMKELIPPGKNLRLLFAFDPNRHAIFFVAGEKTHQWEKWYEVNVPIADKKFDAHLKNIEKRKNRNG